MVANQKMALYAGEIYRLQEYHEHVPLSRLAEHMGVSLQAASSMIVRLSKAAIVQRQPYKGVRLTVSGEHTALLSVRRHRLIEAYLVRVMGFGWDEVHDLTDQLQVGIGQELEDRMFEMAGRPERCPHGEPIPSRDGVMQPLNDVSFTQLDLDSPACITRVRTSEPEKLRYFADLGLRPGVTVSIISRSPFNGPLKISAGSKQHILGHDLASHLWVDPI